MVKTSDYFRVLFIFSILFICSEFSALAKDVDLKPVVATVDGVEISSAAIDSRKDVLSEIAADKKSLTDKEVENLILTEEKQSLARYIRIRIRAKKIKELGLTVSDEELKTESGKILSGVRDGDKAKLDKKMQALIIALDEALKNPSSSDTIYKTELAGLMTKLEWDHHVKHNTPENMANLKKAVPMNWEKMNERMVQHGSSIEGYLLEKKLTEAITKDVAVSDNELTQYLEKENIKNAGPNSEKYRKLYRNELLEKKKQDAIRAWWKSAYDKADVQILDDRFKDVLTSFKQ